MYKGQVDSVNGILILGVYIQLFIQNIDQQHTIYILIQGVLKYRPATYNIHIDTGCPKI